MKSFKVPVKNPDEDFIVTSNLWLTLENQGSGYSYLKKDNKSELLLGFSSGSEAADSAARIDSGVALSSVFDQLAEKQPEIHLFYFHTGDYKVRCSGQADIMPVLYRAKKKECQVLEDMEDYKPEDGDTLVAFTGKMSQGDLDKIGETIWKNGHIAYALSQEITQQLASMNSGARVLFLTDFSEHQSYTFPIKSSLKTVSLTIDMIKNKLVKHELEKIWQVETVLHEALVNAITYGSDLDNSKNVDLSYEMGKKGLRIVVRDTGTGFDVNNISVPVGTEALEKVNGRGIYIMQKFTDAIFFNEKGNVLTLFFNF